MSCSCGGSCGGEGPGAIHGPPAWKQTTADSCQPNGSGGGPNGVGKGLQPGRAPRSMRGDAWPWWLWIVIALVGYRLLKGGL